MPIAYKSTILGDFIQVEEDSGYVSGKDVPINRLNLCDVPLSSSFLSFNLRQ